MKDFKVVQLMHGCLQVEIPKGVIEFASKVELVWQTKVHGIWVDGYEFNNHKEIRQVIRIY